MTTHWTGTYRLQMHEQFPFARAVAILPYLKKLGISHVYLSPCLEAAPGSMHGYDVTNPTRINPELGGEAGWNEFSAAVKAQGLKVLLDIVPNHMSTAPNNQWWDDVLANGPYSEFAPYFDVRREPQDAYQVQLCNLGSPYGVALADGKLTLTLTDGMPRIAHFDNTWPVTPGSWAELVADPSRPEPDPCFAALIALRGIAQPGEGDRAAYAKAQVRAKELLGASLQSGRLADQVAAINQDLDRLDALIQKQFYELHSWKLSGELSNYRRFFDVDSLIGICTERPDVMESTHARIAQMIANDELDGLRIDHPDGLQDPAEYFVRLREKLPQGRIYVEKILENDERLNTAWAVDGTVGYDFLSKVNRLWMDDQRIDALTATYFDFTHQSVNVAAMVRQKKRQVLEGSFAADLNRLAAGLLALARGTWKTRDLSPDALREALAALTVALPVYRTYRTASALDDNDRRILTDSVQRARTAAPDVDAAVFDLLLSLLTKESLTPAEADFALNWQQLAPAVMAKGVEDTTFYCFDRLLSCNEVGSSASLVGISTDKFHEYCHYLSENWPHNQLATSTHDNKRSEDVRTRISLLSEIPEQWAQTLHEWSQLTESSWRGRTPDRHAEYLLYQTLIGAWPITKERCWQYMLKASREAKLRTSWHQPNASYEANIQGFTEGVFENEDFLASLQRFIAPLIMPGRINSLAQTLIKMVIPGVPDFYQGTELWDLSLVDPDNRRPVDYAERGRLLDHCATLTAQDALADWDTGLPKLWLIHRLLALRQSRPTEFGPTAKYQPLVAQGSRLANLYAFRRGENLIAVVPRFNLSVQGGWDDTRLPLPGGRWKSAFSEAVFSEAVTPRQLLQDFPVALLMRE
jgi:(1->4)-alpha-D-glucan 1-alpha-D-glucosylmutase